MSTAEALTAPLPETYHRVQLRRAAIASMVGTTIEWYDFLLYGQVDSIVFAKLFFPKSDPLVGTLEAFGIYFVGFVARPIGAAIFGHYGDRSRNVPSPMVWRWSMCSAGQLGPDARRAFYVRQT